MGCAGIALDLMSVWSRNSSCLYTFPTQAKRGLWLFVSGDADKLGGCRRIIVLGFVLGLDLASQIQLAPIRERAEEKGE